MEYAVLHPGVCNGEKEIVAVTLFGPIAHYKGLGLSIDDLPRTKREVIIRPKGSIVSSREPSESASRWDQEGREPR